MANDGSGKSKAAKDAGKQQATKTPGKAEAGDGVEAARARLAATGRNDACPCGSGKKYKKCHLVGDEAATAPVPEAPDARKTLANAWSLFEQRRPGAAEREFRAALALDGELVDARVGIALARLSANDTETARTQLTEVVTGAEAQFQKLRDDKVIDAFTKTEAQPIIRAAHALGCLAYDQERYDDAVTELERVYRSFRVEISSEVAARRVLHTLAGAASPLRELARTVAYHASLGVGVAGPPFLDPMVPIQDRSTHGSETTANP